MLDDTIIVDVSVIYDKTALILLVGLVFESTGVILLKKGMTHIGDMNGYTAAEIFRVVQGRRHQPANPARRVF